MNETVELSLRQISELAKAVLVSNGASDEHAEAVAETVTKAERDGSISHGLFRIPGYVAALKSGKVKGNPKLTLEQVTPIIFRCDAGNAFAPLAHKKSLPKLIECAQEFGMAALSIEKEHHFAALWPEVETLSEAGLVGFTCVSYLPWVAPAGGKKPIFGTNPMGFSWPVPGDDPIVIDMATSSMAMGEVQIAAREGHEVPLGTGLSAEGELTTNASKIAEGVLLPFGGHKGSALALMVELLAGPLVGETFSYESQKRDNADGGPAQGGQFILAMSPELLSGGTTWIGQTEDFLREYASIDGARIPGARRHQNRKDTGPRLVNAKLFETITLLK